MSRCVLQCEPSLKQTKLPSKNVRGLSKIFIPKGKKTFVVTAYKVLYGIQLQFALLLHPERRHSKTGGVLLDGSPGELKGK